MPLWNKKLAEAFGHALSRGDVRPGQTKENMFDPYRKHIRKTEKFAETGDEADLITTDVGRAIPNGQREGANENYLINRQKPELGNLAKSEVIDQGSDRRLEDDFEKVFDEMASKTEHDDAVQNIRKAIIEDLQSGMDISDVFEKYRSF